MFREILRKLDIVIQNQSLILQNQSLTIKKILDMNPTLQALQAEVANNTSVENSAILLIQGLAAQIAAAGTDPAALAAIVTSLQTNDAALAAAVAANTPAQQTNS